MKEEFLQAFLANNLPMNGGRYLLAISGGIDSMTLLALFRACHIPCAVAHCNFMLRGQDARLDESFVRETAAAAGLSFHLKRFQTRAYARKHGISIQMAARELRYNWFQGLAREEGYDYLVTAHHADDQLETFFINLLRGSGIKGLQGIPILQANLFRPLARVSKAQIEAYALAHSIPYRIDHTNDESHYLRNKIRHRLIPLLSELQPAFLNVMLNNFNRIREENALYEIQLQQQLSEISSITDKETRVNLSALAEKKNADFLLSKILEKQHCLLPHFPSVNELLTWQSGKYMIAQQHRITRNREELIVKKIRQKLDKTTVLIPLPKNTTSGLPIKHLGFTLIFKTIPYVSGFPISPDPSMAYLDSGKLQFPLLLRTWKAGDRFYPLGMNSKKKISDFLTDEKVPSHEKGETLVLCNQDQVAWVVGHRVDNRYRVSEKTNKILVISLLHT